MIDFIHSYGKFIIAGVVAVIILTTESVILEPGICHVLWKISKTQISRN